MTKNRRGWVMMNGLIILCGLLMHEAAMGQNVPSDPNSAVTPSTRVLVAEAAGATAQQGGAAEPSVLQEVVVTATHFATEANQTPIAITAVTVGTLLQEGVSTFQDLAATVPDVSIFASSSPGLANIAIRGIQQTGGAATTGFYLDNAPLQLWSDSLASSPTGTPLPPIFDLQRAEILEGPQGTLFGSSSEGGTVREITPQPSLNDWHVYAKLEGSETVGATGQNYSPGLAVGGPIVPGVLGFRASVFDSHQAGWIKAEDPYTQQIFATGLNTQDVQEFHGALLWQATTNFSVLGSYFSSYQSTPYNSDTVSLSEPYPIVAPTIGYNNTVPSVGGKAVCSSNPVAKLPNCTGYTGVVTHITPGGTYGPYSIGSNTDLETQPNTENPAHTGLRVSEIDLNDNLPSFTAALYSTYVVENTFVAPNSTLSDVSRTVVDAQEGPFFVPMGLGFDATLPDQGYEVFVDASYRKTIAEDLRFSSVASPDETAGGIFSWTGGLYYEHDYADAILGVNVPYGSMQAFAEQQLGETATQRWGVAPLQIDPADAYEAFAAGKEEFTDLNEAVYAQANYNIVNNLQATVGLRYSYVSFGFLEYDYGPISATSSATIANGGIALASAGSTPFTPKGELTYRFTRNDLIYLSAAEGFRPGGPNPEVAASICGAGAASYGDTVFDTPTSYKSDTDWDYEVGTKDLVDNGRVQLNASAYHILWSGVQLSSNWPGCNHPFITNAGHAASNGFEFSTQALVGPAVQLNFAVGFDHAYYTEEAIAIPASVSSINKPVIAAPEGQTFALPAWTGDIGVRFDLRSGFGWGGNLDPYIRADERIASSYVVASPAASTYTPIGNEAPPSSDLNLRAGITAGNLDFNVYALNALNYLNGHESGGPSNCANPPACTSYTSFSPIYSRTPYNYPVTVGLQLTYTH